MVFLVGKNFREECTMFDARFLDAEREVVDGWCKASILAILSILCRNEAAIWR